MFTAVLLVLLSACSKYKEISVTSYKVDSMRMEGLRSLIFNLTVDVDNPAGAVAFYDIEFDFILSGKKVGKMVVDPFDLLPRTAHTYNLRTAFLVDNGVSFKEVMSLMKDFNKDEIQMDARFTAKLKSGAKKKFKYEKISLTELFKSTSGNEN